MTDNIHLLLVANVAKEHVRKFHIPTIVRMREKGWAIDVACSNDADIPECDNYFDMKYGRNPISPKTLTGALQLRKILKNKKYDIIYCHTATGGIVARLATIGLRAEPTVIYMAHGFHFYRGSSLLSWLLFYPVEKILAKRTDYLITINTEDYELAKIKKLYKKDVFLVPGIGVDFERLGASNKELRADIRKDLGISENDTVLVYVAELTPNKNQGKLIEVTQKLSEKHSNIKLLLVGPDHNDAKYLKYANELGISNKVIFTGWRNDIGALLYASDICVASSRREGLGLNLIEAMQCGLPAVAFDNRGHREIIENGVNGYITEPDNIEDMVSSIEKVIDGRYEKMSEEARISSQKYEKGKIVEMLIGIIESALDQTL